MKHPNQARLALHAGGDLGFVARWWTGVHLASCPRCRREVAAYQALRDVVPDLAEIPEVPWNRLSAEMKANIRLGLAAGECVRQPEQPLRDSPGFARGRAVVAFASAAALLLAGLVLQRPAPKPLDDGAVVQAMHNGIQVEERGRALGLMHGGALNVTYSVGAQGSMRARYVDPETGLVTINNVYVE
jgi:hypothetical protein